MMGGRDVVQPVGAGARRATRAEHNDTRHHLTYLLFHPLKATLLAIIFIPARHNGHFGCPTEPLRPASSLCLQWNVFREPLVTTGSMPTPATAVFYNL